MPTMKLARIACAMAVLILGSRDAGAQADDLPVRLRTTDLIHSHARALGASSAAPETVYIGYTPGHASDNYWSIWAGTSASGTFHRPPAQGGMWDFEPPHVHQDSLQGWWPYRVQMTGTGGLTIADHLRPWRALDFGNNANYAGPFGPGPDGRKRTFGVIGVWHIDGGNTVARPSSLDYTSTLYGPDPVLGVGGVNWAPLEGASSAWMGLRRHGDDAYADPLTGNPFTENLLAYQFQNAVASAGTDKKFPGYGAQMDQLLYRDIELAPTDTVLTVSFHYRTAMSTGFSTNNQTRTGWFVHDPLTVITGGTNPNYIVSASTNPAPPVDSFTVYVGAPAESAVVLSDGASHAIYDPQRRWFGEVLRSNEGLYRQLFSKGGPNAVTSAGGQIGGAALAAIKAAGGNRARLVFRVKTNHVFDDETRVTQSYSSGGVGAAIVDEVRFGTNGAPPADNFAGSVQGRFNNPADIDNDLAASATLKWKSTGKPPQTYFHLHDLASLTYEDICGQADNPNRICNLRGVVFSMGNHDRNEETGHTDIAAEMEPFDRIISPTIQLCGPYAGSGGVNRMGLTQSQVTDADDFSIDYEMYAGAFDFFTSGNTWHPGFQSYPAGNTAGGVGEHKRWGEIRYPGFRYFNPDKQCFRVQDVVRGNGMLRTSNAGGLPDSVRIIMRRHQECFRFAITNCVTADGGYWDNFSLGIPLVSDSPPLTVDIWQFIQDSFPFNQTPGIAHLPAAFDTTTVLIKSGLNIAPFTGNTNRFDVPGDTTVVFAPGASVRVDLVFRVLPGPGNYIDPALGVASQLKAVPSAAAAIPTPVSGVANFWSNYMFLNGSHGSPGGHPTATSGPLSGQRVWSPHVWNSPRCDTAELNVFQLHKRGVIHPSELMMFMSAYHEDELASAHRGALGIPRNLCFVSDSSVSVSTQSVICGSGNMPPGVSYPPVWTNAPWSGLPASCTAASCVTREGTKIIPDGLLTPGSHVQYFFRREDAGGFGVVMCPDTTVAIPQLGEGSADGHRWQQFSVLPDRWKSPAYVHPVIGTPGAGNACMLVIDQADRRGDEHIWNVTAEALGITAVSRRGAHNGVATPLNGDPNDPANFVRAHIGQAGTTWDLYNVKAGEALNAGSGSIGSRYARNDPSNTQINGKRSLQGPAHEMLASHYSLIVLLTGDLSSAIFGPFTNKSQDDVGVLQTWLMSGDTTVVNRGILVHGDGVIEANEGGAASVAFSENFLGARLRHPGYHEFSGNTFPPYEVSMSGAISPDGNRFDVDSGCDADLDVLSVSSALASETIEAGFYPAFGAGAPYAASVLKSHSSARPWIALSNGWDLDHLRGFGSESDAGRVAYFRDVLGSVFGVACPQLSGGPVTSVAGESLREFFRIDGNPARRGMARVHLAIARAGRIEVKLYDIAGRAVRTLADRSFTAGEHTLSWDGRDAAGSRMASGVYFVRMRQANGFVDTKKLVVLGP